MTFKKRTYKRKKLALIIALASVAILVCIVASTTVIGNSTKTRIYADKELIPHTKVGLIFGTAQYAVAGGKNLFFEYRMQAGYDLYKAGKINYILVSGDNRKDNYNEPVMMRDALMKLGVPIEHIILDFAGLRTFDSVVRAKEVFGCEHVILISQRFQIERALYIAESKGINAYGFTAEDVPSRYGIKTQVREYLARVKMMLDLHILNTQPKHLGPQVIIGE
jgi:SanA protein